MQLRVEGTSYGHELFDAETGAKVAVVKTSDHSGTYVQKGHPVGVIGVQKATPREMWVVHLTSTVMKPDDLIAVAEAVKALPEFDEAAHLKELTGK